MFLSAARHVMLALLVFAPPAISLPTNGPVHLASAAQRHLAAACTSCGPGTFIYNNMCTVCAAGTLCPAGGAAPSACPAGFWCQGGKQHVCGGSNLFCPANSSTPTTVAIGHYTVPIDGDVRNREGQLACESGSSCSRGVRADCPAGRICRSDYPLAPTVRVFSSSGEVVTVRVTSQQRCADDAFVFNGTCVACPARGAACIDGLIALKPGFWFDPRHGSLAEFWGKRAQGALSPALGIYQCAPGACDWRLSAASAGAAVRLGMPACARGRQGLLCGVCSEGFYATDNSDCKACPTGASHAAGAAGFVALLLVIGGAVRVLKRRLGRHLRTKHPRVHASVGKKLPEVLKLLVGMFQILGALATVLSLDVPWPGAFRTIVSVSSVLSLDALCLSCSGLCRTFYARFDLHMAVVLVLTALFGALLAYAHSRRNQSRARPLKIAPVWNIFLAFLFVVYPSISKTVVQMLRCRTIDGASFLLADLALSCETAEYASHRRFAIFGLLVFPIGIVVFFAALVGRNRTKLPPDWWPARAEEQAKVEYAELRAARTSTSSCTHAAWQAEVWGPRMAQYEQLHTRFGFLFSAYSKGFWWFESAILLYKLLMTVLILCVSDGDENKILVRACERANFRLPLFALSARLTAPPSSIFSWPVRHAGRHRDGGDSGALPAIQAQRPPVGQHGRADDAAARAARGDVPPGERRRWRAPRRRARALHARTGGGRRGAGVAAAGRSTCCGGGRRVRAEVAHGWQ
jgi:hypothetical protein